MEGEIKARTLDMISKGGKAAFYYWNISENTWWVKKGNFLGLTLESDDYNPIVSVLILNKLSQESRFVYDRYVQRIINGINKPIGNNSLSVTFRVSSENAQDRIYTFTSYFNKDDNGKIVEIAGEGREYTQQEILDNEILTKFTMDKKPDIFYDQVDKMLSLNKDCKYAFIQFDIECFKLINDKYGKKKGDEILSYITEMMGVLCNMENPFTRISADIFMVVMKYIDKNEIYDFINTLNFYLGCYDGIEYKLVFGVNLLDERSEHDTVRNLIDGAAMARNTIKGNEMKNIAVFKKNLRQDIEYRKNMGHRLKHALENEEFVMYLQPKFDIKTENLTGAEALVRWKHPEAGLILPEQFIYVLEANGYILNIDKFIWEEACKTIKNWMEAGKRACPISVNVSRTYLDAINIVDYFKMLVEKYEIPVHLLEIEITETSENKETVSLINELKRAGFTLLMDDFGSGYSSLNMLKSTPFDVLKLDRAFLSEFMENDRGKKIISHTIEMAKDMGISLVAEGVETKEQADFLYKCGCTTAQGYYFSEPMTVEEFECLI